jgi:hypothetical protein
MVDNKNLVEAEQSRRISSALCQHVWIRERLIDRGIMVEYIGTYLGAHILRNIFFFRDATTEYDLPRDAQCYVLCGATLKVY